MATLLTSSALRSTRHPLVQSALLGIAAVVLGGSTAATAAAAPVTRYLPVTNATSTFELYIFDKKDRLYAHYHMPSGSRQLVPIVDGTSYRLDARYPGGDARIYLPSDKSRWNLWKELENRPNLGLRFDRERADIDIPPGEPIVLIDQAYYKPGPHWYVKVPPKPKPSTSVQRPQDIPGRVSIQNRTGRTMAFNIRINNGELKTRWLAPNEYQWFWGGAHPKYDVSFVPAAGMTLPPGTPRELRGYTLIPGRDFAFSTVAPGREVDLYLQ